MPQAPQSGSPPAGDELVAAVQQLANQLDEKQKEALRQLGQKIQTAATQDRSLDEIDPLLRQGLAELRPDQRNALQDLAQRFRKEAEALAPEALGGLAGGKERREGEKSPASD